MAALPITPPQVNIQSEGLAGSKSGILFGSNKYLLSAGSGAPTGGDDWAGPGSIAITDAGAIYTQTGTLATPVWTINAA